jgi:hypothetical protein
LKEWHVAVVVGVGSLNGKIHHAKMVTQAEEEEESDVVVAFVGKKITKMTHEASIEDRPHSYDL